MWGLRKDRGKVGATGALHTVDQDPPQRHPPSTSLLGRFLRWLSALSALSTAGNMASDGSWQDHAQPKLSLVFHPNQMEKRPIGPAL